MAKLKDLPAGKTLYARLERFIRQERGFRRTLGRNTVARLTARDGLLSVAVALYSTDVIVANELGHIMLNSDGYRTVTTKDRINRILHGTPLVVFQKQGVWFVKNHDLDHVATFSDGIEYYRGADGLYRRW